MRALCAGILAFAAWAAGTAAQSVEDYDACIALVATDPEAAVRDAGEWSRYGGGAPARHCYALSLIEIGAPLRAADELIGIAVEEADLSNPARADILVQAGELLVDRDDTVTAAVVAAQARQLDPQNPGAMGLSAAVSLANGDVRAALTDLDRALAIKRDGLSLLLRRASAHRRLGNGVAARDDASYATELQPREPSAWLERGRAEAMLDDKVSARTSFIKAVGLDRDGKIGRAAQLA
ncbi:MAG: hypothetical protein AAGB15_07085, partial [Pseudomonadota bacterium]